jgi:hypothetical protein
MFISQKITLDEIIEKAIKEGEAILNETPDYAKVQLTTQYEIDTPNFVLYEVNFTRLNGRMIFESILIKNKTG